MHSGRVQAHQFAPRRGRISAPVGKGIVTDNASLSTTVSCVRLLRFHYPLIWNLTHLDWETDKIPSGHNAAAQNPPVIGRNPPPGLCLHVSCEH